MCKQITYLVILSLVFSLVGCKKKDDWVKMLDSDDLILRYPSYKMQVFEESNSVTSRLPELPDDNKISVIHERRRKNIIVHPETVTSCNLKNYSTALIELRKNIGCKPRERIVELEAPGGVRVFPDTIIIKSCAGVCGGKQCISAGTREVEFYVRKVEKGKSECSTIKILEDTACKCGCSEKKRKCLEVQRFNESNCKCVCKDENAANICKLKRNSKWVPSSCTCTCRKRRECTTGTVWDESTCRCQKVRP